MHYNDVEPYRSYCSGEALMLQTGLPPQEVGQLRFLGKWGLDFGLEYWAELLSNVS